MLRVGVFSVVVGAVALAACAPEGEDVANDEGALSFHGAPSLVDSTMPDVDAIGYDIALEIDPKTRATFQATVDGLFVATRALSELELDLEGNEVVSVAVDGNAAKFTRRGDKLVVATGSKSSGRSFSIRVSYKGALYSADGANPNDFVGYGGLMTRRSNAVGNAIISSLNWPYKARRWLPLRDHPRDGAMVTMKLTFPSDLSVVANGAKKNVLENKDGTKTWSYEALTPMPTYDFHLAAYEGWTETRERSGSTTVHGYAYPEHANTARQVYDDLPEALSFYAKTFGAYRFGNEVSFLEEPIFGGGMEHAGVVSLDETLFDSPSKEAIASSREVAFHELAHHWSGNLARIGTWNDFWLSEGFTDYLTGRALEAVDGEAAGLVYWNKLKSEALSADRSANHALRPAGNDIDVLEIFDGISYKKGAFVLRSLEKVVGRDVLTRFLKTWFERHSFKAVATDDLKRELEAATRQDLSDFFDAFVFSAGAPSATVRVQKMNGKATVTVDTSASSKKATYELDVALKNGAREKRVTVSVSKDKSVQSVEMPLDFEPISIVADPDAATYGTFRTL